MTINFKQSEIKEICSQIDDSFLDNFKYLLLFVGHAHSGHSIIGSILDCHPDISIANEVNIVKSIQDYNLSRQEILKLLLFQSLKSKQENNKWLNSEYQYDIETEYQGKSTKPKIIGDKKGGGTTRILINNPKLLNFLLNTFKGKVKVIFVKRKPEEIVAAYAYYMKQPLSQFHVDRYIENMEYVNHLKSVLNEMQLIEINQNVFINQPIKILSTLFGFLDIDFEINHLKDWAAIVKNNITPKSDQIRVPDRYRTQLIPYY